MRNRNQNSHNRNVSRYATRFPLSPFPLFPPSSLGKVRIEYAGVQLRHDDGGTEEGGLWRFLCWMGNCVGICKEVGIAG